MHLTDALIDRGLVPKPLLRRGVRRALRERLAEQREIYGPGPDSRAAGLQRWVESMRRAPIAITPKLANEQHYEVPAEFYRLVLGARLKYSCAYYPEPTTTLDEAEHAMLGLTCARARLEDGQRILELGCGWGSLALYVAERFPRSHVSAVSNSSSQREFIRAEAARRGLRNVTALTADMNDLAVNTRLMAGSGGARFDRIVSVEMFEHMRNWERLLGRARTWLRDDGLLFQHVFAHRSYAYAYEDHGTSDWMTRHFFGGGMMPCHDLLDSLDVPFELERRWIVDGSHYERTAEDWLRNLEARHEGVVAVLADTYGADQAEAWFQRWRLFFIACAALFGYDGGQEWFVSHNLLAPTTCSPASATPTSASAG